MPRRSSSPDSSSEKPKRKPVVRKSRKGPDACEDTATLGAHRVAQLNAELQDVANQIRDLNPAVLRERARRKKKSERAILGDSTSRRLLERFRKKKNETVATSALRLLLHDCGPRCMGCPHGHWGVWVITTGKKSGKKAPALVRLTLAKTLKAGKKTDEPEASEAASTRDPERAAHYLQMQVLAYARKAPDPKTLRLVRRALKLLEEKRKLLEAFVHLGRLARARRTPAAAKGASAPSAQSTTTRPKT